MIMKLPFILALVIATQARADPPKVAVFDFELVDTSLQGEVYGPRPDEHHRLTRAGDQLRKEPADSGKFQIVNIAPVNAAAHGSNLQACGGCDVRFAEQLGADLVLTGVVQKVSNLILNIEHLSARRPQRPDLHRCQRRSARQYRRVLDASDELSGAQSAARAQLRRAAPQ